MRLDLIQIVLFFPLAIAISLVMGAVGRNSSRDIVRACGRTFTTLLMVVGGVGLVIRLLVLFFV